MTNPLDHSTTATYTIALCERFEFEQHLRGHGATIKWATAGATWRVEGPLSVLRNITDFLNTMREQ